MSAGPPDKPGRALRRAMARGCVAMPGAFNAGIARLVERAGFEGVYISGAGLAGLHIEDQVFPKRCGHLGGKELVPAKEMVQKLRAAVRARNDKDFVIVARTDARAVEGFNAAVERAKLYLEAGADAIFPEALETAAEFRKFAREVPAPLMANMTEFGKSPLLSVRQLGSMGYRMAIFPMTVFRVAMKAAEECLADLHRRGTQRGWQGRMQTRAELYDLLGYDPAQDHWPLRPGRRKEVSK